MEVRLDRKWKKKGYTIGRIYINGEFICNSLEDEDRNLCQGQGEKYIKEHKKYGVTAIPRGRYRITLDVVSGTFGKRKYYKEFCEGKLPRLLDVPGFLGILLHRGTNAGHSEGCILLGDNTVKGQLTNSQARFEEVYNLMKEADDKGEEIWIDID